MSNPEEQRPTWRAILRESLTGSDRDFARLELRMAIPLLAIPMVFEMGMEAVFALADVFFVSRLGADAIATVGLTESVLTLIYAMAIGMAMPVTAMVARRYGEGDRDGASRVGAQALLLALGVGLAIGIPAPFFADEILVWMGAEPTVVAMGSGYTAIMLGTNAAIMMLFIAGAIFRGAGDAPRAMRALWIANGINLVLDPCLIFGLGPFPEMGVTGAAVATSIGRSIGVAYQLRAFVAGPRLTLNLALLRPIPKTLLEILRLSVGGVGQYIIGTSSFVVLIRILAEFGSQVVAGYTVAVRVVIFVLLPSWGFANATATLVGQSLGANDPKRAEQAVRTSGIYNMVFLGSVSIVLIAWPEAVASVFTDDAVVLRWAASALRIISYGYVFYAWEMVLLQAFNGAGDTFTPTLVNLVAFWLIEIPIAWVLAHTLAWGPNGVFASIAGSYSLAAVLAFLAFRTGRWKKTRV